MKRIHDGAIGEIVVRAVLLEPGRAVEPRPRQPEWSDMEWQVRNWLYFTWLSGDHICEQHVHNIDVINWAIGNHPDKAVGMGGRQVRTDPAYGHIFDHFAIDFEYPNGVHVMSMCRQIDGCCGQRIGARRGHQGHIELQGFHCRRQCLEVRGRQPRRRISRSTRT